MRRSGVTRFVYRNYLLGILLVALAFNSVDRVALGLMLQSLKADLSLSDTQLGLLSGIAFSLFYSVMGVPIARWADRGNRVMVLSLTTALWSVAMALCGLTHSYLQLMLVRVGVAVGEAGCIPAAHSLIPDYFSRTERPRAVAIYTVGGTLGAVTAYFLAGWLNESFGWRATFMLIGAPGLVLAAVTWFTLEEPRLTEPFPPSTAAPLGFKEVALILWGNITYRRLLLCFSAIAFFGNGIIQWQPAFVMRSYGLGSGELGAWFAVLYGLGGLAGAYAGGALATRYAAHNERLQLTAMAIAYCGLATVDAWLFLTRNRELTFALIAVGALAGTMVIGPLFATVQTLVPERLRATSIAIIYLFSNLIGWGLGPLVAGALSDVLRPLFAQESLRYALLALSPGYLWAAWQLWRARRSVMGDLWLGTSPACST
jgi:MFS family permease